MSAARSEERAPGRGHPCGTEVPSPVEVLVPGDSESSRRSGRGNDVDVPIPVEIGRGHEVRGACLDQALRPEATVTVHVLLPRQHGCVQDIEVAVPVEVRGENFGRGLHAFVDDAGGGEGAGSGVGVGLVEVEDRRAVVLRAGTRG